ncbi:alpha/beta fold hydrolase [Pseudothauera rhizosphaerae]|uniref:Alpha/beta hydrolase n=1 Tax=Pseudothauera rhizosphaerae TaxID=2565932 RepID=A0A4S4AML5_9RHOO|nr:alpha/beta hydrolase [Pseudothauera rhizosphaerae]THF60830.1 alpha/beta hydrolase [Pseudothauera rhizosphaerae]
MTRPELPPAAGLPLPHPTRFVDAGGHRLETCWIPGLRPGAPALVFLHQGLGCADMWRDFPAQVVAATGCPALVYSRYGYGRSEPRSTPRGVDYLHVEALEVLPALLDALDIHDPVLVGHSDGGSIALLHAAEARRRVRGLVVMAPHEFVEELTLAGIRDARQAWFDDPKLRERLARYHPDAKDVFFTWNDTWLLPEFRAWNIEACLDRIACPVLAIQGEDDEYGTLRQIQVIAEHVADTELLALADCRHSPHRDQPEAVVEAIARFVARLAPGG